LDKFKKYHAYGCFALLTVTGLYLFQSLIFFDHTLFFRDFYRNVYPAKIQALNLMSTQGVFAWNPYLDGGLPLLADISHHFALYPGNLLFYFLDAVSAFNGLILIHFVLAGMGMYSLGILKHRSPYCAFISAFAWVLSGFYLSSINRPGYFFTVSWLPWVAWAWLRINESQLKSSLCLAVISLLQLLASEVQVAILSQITGFVLYASNAKNNLITIKLLKNLVIAGLIFLGLGAIQILPAFELSMLSTRGAGIPFERLTVNSLYPYQLITLLLPFPFPIFPSEAGFQGYTEFFGSNGIPLFVSLHAGSLIFCVSLISLVKIRNREQIIWLVATLFFLFLSFGKYFPNFFKIAHHFIPFGSSFIFPIKYFLPSMFFLCLLAGNFFADQEIPAKKYANETVLLIITFLVLISGFLIFPALLIKYKDSLGNLAYSQINNTIHQQCLLTVLFISGFTLISIFKSLPHKKTLLLSLIVIELLFYSHRIIWTTHRSFFSTPPAFPELLKFESNNILPPFRIEVNKMETPPSMIQIQGIDGLVERRRWKFQGMIPNTRTINGLAYTFKYGPQRLMATYNLWVKSGLSKLDIYRLYSTRFYLTPYPVGYKKSSFLDNKQILLKDSSRGIYLYEDQAARPLAWLTETWQRANPALRISSLSEPVPIDSEQQIALPGRNNENASNWLPVSDIIRTSNGYEISVSSKSPSFLIISENAYPGWEAKLDGKPVEIKKAYGIFKAVYIPQGQHKVKFHFKSKSILIGLIFSIISLLIIIGCLFRQVFTSKSHNG